MTREGDKVGLILGLAFIAVALLALPRSGGFRSIVFLLFLLGVGGGIVVTGANALVSAVSPDHRATALNLVNLFFGLGGLATPFIAANLFKRNWLRLCYTVASAHRGGARRAVCHPCARARAGCRIRAGRRGPGAWPAAALPARSCSCFSTSPAKWASGTGCRAISIAQGIPEQRALNILSLGFALGLLVGRVGVSPILISVPANTVLLAASIAMAVTTFLMLRTVKPVAAAALVFIAGLSMAPVFPTTLAIVGTAFPRMTGTAIGFVITCGWAGLAVSSRIIGAIAGGDPLRLKKALLIIPGFAVLMIGLNLVIGAALR